MKFKSSYWNLVDFVFSLVFTIILNKLITGMLGYDGYGIYALSMVVNGSLALLDFGLSNALTKYISSEDDNIIRNEYITSTILIYIVFFVFSMMLMWLFNDKIYSYFAQYTSNYRIFIIFSLLNLFLTLVSFVFTGVLVSQSKWKNLVYGNLIFKIVNFSILILICFYLKADLIFFCFSIICSLVLKNIFYYKCLLNNGLQYKFLYSKEKINKITSYVKYSFINASSGFALNQLDKILVAKYIGVTELGLYSFVAQIVNFIYSFFCMISRVKFPVIAGYHNELEYKKIHLIISLLTKKLVLISLIILAVVIILWKPVIGVYMDHIYAEKTYLMSCLFFVYLIFRVFELNTFYLLSALGDLKLFSLATFIISFIFYIFIHQIILAFNVNGVIYFKITMSAIFYFGLYVYYMNRIKNHEKASSLI